MPRNGSPAGDTPRSAKAATPGGITPSPQALSIGACLGSKTVTSRPRRAAYSAVASPAGPPPTTIRSRRATPGRSAASGLQGRERPLFDPYPLPEQRRVERRERCCRDPRGMDKGKCRALHDDGDIVRVAQPSVGTRLDPGQAGDDDDTRIPLRAESADAPPAQALSPESEHQHR